MTHLAGHRSEGVRHHAPAHRQTELALGTAAAGVNGAGVRGSCMLCHSGYLYDWHGRVRHSPDHARLGGRRNGAVPTRFGGRRDASSLARGRKLERASRKLCVVDVLVLVAAVVVSVIVVVKTLAARAGRAVGHGTSRSGFGACECGTSGGAPVLRELTKSGQVGPVRGASRQQRVRRSDGVPGGPHSPSAAGSSRFASLMNVTMSSAGSTGLESSSASLVSPASAGL